MSRSSLFVRAVAGSLALWLGSAAVAQQTQFYVYLPSGSGTPLVEAATKLADELEAIYGASWDYSIGGSPSSGETAVVVTVNTAYAFPSPAPHTALKADAYHLSGEVATGFAPITVGARTAAGALAGLHGLRLYLRQHNYLQVNPADIGEFVNPAFVRRGFLVLPPRGFSATQWRDLIDYHQLLGANTITITPTWVYDAADPRTQRLKGDQEAVVAALAHCKQVGVKCVIGTGANLVDPSFFWDRYEPACEFYDRAATVGAYAQGGGNGTPQVNLGAESVQDPGANYEHTLPHYGVATSLNKLAQAGETSLLDAHQATTFADFVTADAWLIGITESATDYSAGVLGDPVQEVINDGFMRVSARIENAETQASQMGLPSGNADLVYWGWLHDVWNRNYLDDPKYTTYPAWGAWDEVDTTGSYQAIQVQIGDHQSMQGLTGAAEWVQETGAFYAVLEIHNNVLAGVRDPLATTPATYFAPDFGLDIANQPELYALVDPLGFLDKEGLPFEATAFLYWNHVEIRPRNRVLRPAIRSTVADMRAALRRETFLARGGRKIADWSHPGVPASGIMGYRFLYPETRPLNDYVVLRCASDDRLLGFDEENSNDVLDLTVSDVTQAKITEDIARFLVKGLSSWNLVSDSIGHLDDAQSLFDAPALPAPGVVTRSDKNAILESGLAVLDPGAPWWDASNNPVSEEYEEYYHLLAFLFFAEKAAELKSQDPPDPSASRFEKAALEVARQTRLLGNYSTGEGGSVAGLIDDLMGGQ